MSYDSLEQYCKTEGLKGIYMIPDFQNPTTHTLSLERRQMTIARNHMVDTILGDYHLAGSPECNFRFLSLPKGLEGKSFDLFHFLYS